MTGKYVAGDGAGEEAAKAFVSLNWVLTEEPLDVETELALGFLDYLLLGTSAAPLRKALNDSGLGEALIGGGLMDELRQPVFSLGLKGVDPADSQKVGCKTTPVIKPFLKPLLTPSTQLPLSCRPRGDQPHLQPSKLYLTHPSVRLQYQETTAVSGRGAYSWEAGRMCQGGLQ